MSLLDKIGGEEAISLITDKFYDYALSDHILSPSFANKDIKKLKQKTKRLLETHFQQNIEYHNNNASQLLQQSNQRNLAILNTWNNIKAALEFYRVRAQIIQQIKQSLVYSQDNSPVIQTLISI